jgi:tetratricopeptide (TPR) repeat protein
MDSPPFDVLCQQARRAVAQRDYDQARQLYLQALIQKPDATDVHYGLGAVFFLLNDLESAAHHYRQVIRIDALHAPAHINLGAVYNRLDLYDKAIQVLRKAIQLAPKRPEGYYNLALVYRGKGDPNLALQAYREALRVNPKMADAHLNIANLHFERGELPLAKTHYEHALESRPNWEPAVKGLAQVEQATLASKATAPEPPKVDDPERILDPESDGVVLIALHQGAITGDDQARRLIKLIEEQLEPALKALSSDLLVSHGMASDLEASLTSFGDAFSAIETLQAELFANLEEIQKYGQNLFQ